jgi:hypothetical protein
VSDAGARTDERSANRARGQIAKPKSLRIDLDEAALFDFASSEMFAETVLALSKICDLPVDLVERALVEERLEQVLVLAKAVGLTWKTTKAILLLQARTGRSTDDLGRLLETFLRLKPETARQAVQFYRLRERSLAPRTT